MVDYASVCTYPICIRIFVDLGMPRSTRYVQPYSELPDIYQPNSAHQQFAKHSHLHLTHFRNWSIYVTDRQWTNYALHVVCRGVNVLCYLSRTMWMQLIKIKKLVNMTASCSDLCSIDLGRERFFLNGPWRPTDPDKKGKNKKKGCI